MPICRPEFRALGLVRNWDTMVLTSVSCLPNGEQREQSRQKMDRHEKRVVLIWLGSVVVLLVVLLFLILSKR